MKLLSVRQLVIALVVVPQFAVIDLATSARAQVAAEAVSVDSLPSSRQPETDASVRFNFAYAPWKEVLEQFAKTAGLSLVLDAPPPGTFNYTDGKPYTPAEAIDVMNSVLLTKGYTLIRRDKMLMVINVDDGIPPDLLTTIPVEELDNHGKFELARCLFKLETISPEAADEEVKKMIGRQGTVEVLARSRQILVTETAGRLRTIRDTLHRIEHPGAEKALAVSTLALRHITPDDALIVIRQMMGLPEGQNADTEGLLRLAVSPAGRQIIVSASAVQQARIIGILQLIDTAPDESRSGITDVPQLEVYSITEADSESVLQVIQTLFAEDERIKLASDPRTGNLVALAKPSQHSTIRATLEQMQKDAREIEVIPLYTVDPKTAVLSINKLFGAEDPESKKAPKVEADVTGGNLMIRGTKSQIADIRTLLNKLGEGESSLDRREKGNVRMLSITGQEAQMILDQASQIWPNLRANRIRTILPANLRRAISPRSVHERKSLDTDETPKQEDSSESPDKPKSSTSPNPDRTGSTGSDLRTSRTIAQVTAEEWSLRLAQADQPVEVDSKQPVADANLSSTESTDGKSTENVTGSDIIIAPGPNGLMITSRDRAALDAFEELVLSLSDRGTSSEKQYTVFYLQFEKADRAASLLKDVLGAGGGGSSGGGVGGTLLGDLAGAALGDSGGGLVGSLLGLGESGGAVESTDGIKIVANDRLNSLIVEAKAKDLDLIEQLLQVIDQKKSPEKVQTLPAPRLIPVLHTNAQDIESVVRSVYSDRILGSGGQQQQPRPEDFIRALRGGRGRGDSGGEAEEDKPFISLGVDQKNNALVVAAPDPVFEEIKSLVQELDRIDGQSSEATRVITLKRANPALIRRALAAVVGRPEAVAQSAVTAPSGQRAEGPGEGGRVRPPGEQRDDPEAQLRQRAEFFRAMQEQQREREQNTGRRGRGQEERPNRERRER